MYKKIVTGGHTTTPPVGLCGISSINSSSPLGFIVGLYQSDRVWRPKFTGMFYEWFEWFMIHDSWPTYKHLYIYIFRYACTYFVGDMIYLIQPGIPKPFIKFVGHSLVTPSTTHWVPQVRLHGELVSLAMSLVVLQHWKTQRVQVIKSLAVVIV